MNTTATARRLRREQTEEEKHLWRALRAGRFAGFKFRRQHPLGGYFQDFFYPAARLAVGLDGFQHGVLEEQQHNAERTRHLAPALLALTLALAVGLLSGCVLPGGDRPVGAMRIEGRATVAGQPAWVGQDLHVVVRRDHLREQLAALDGVGDPACNPATHKAAFIGQDGCFGLSIPPFLSGDPIWIIPPLGTLPLFTEPADKQGLVFLLRTPPPQCKTYEIDARKDTTRVRMLKDSKKGFRSLTVSEREEIAVSASTVRSNSPSALRDRLRVVSIRLTPRAIP